MRVPRSRRRPPGSGRIGTCCDRQVETGEAVTFYAALLEIGAMQGAVTGSESPEELLERIDAGSPGWFIAGAVIAALLVTVAPFPGRRRTQFSREQVWWCG